MTKQKLLDLILERRFNMKKIVYLSVIFYSFLFSIKCQASIAYLDVNHILQNSYDGKKIIEELDLLKKNNENLFNLKTQNLENQRKKLNKIKNITYEEEFKKKILELKIKIDEFNQLKKDKLLSYEQFKEEKLNNFFVSLNEILSNYIKVNKIKIIIDNKNIVIADKSLDITNDILNLINKN